MKVSYVINPVLVIVNTFLMMFMISTLWGWFVVPLGVVEIGMAQAFGISLMITYFQVRNPRLIKPEFMVERTFTQRFSTNLGMTLTALILGYITSLFM